jgi:hypothetical protein
LELNVVRVLKCHNVKVRNAEVSVFNGVEIANVSDTEMTKREDIEIWDLWRLEGRKAKMLNLTESQMLEMQRSGLQAC